MRDVLVRVPVERRPVGLHGTRLVHVERRGLRDAVVREIPLARDEDVLVVGLRQRRDRIDHDRAVHSVRDVSQHRLRAAVVHEHARVVRAEAEGERLARGDVPEGDIRRDASGMEVDRVRDGATVRERHFDHLPLAHMDDRPGRAMAVECPGVVLHAGRDLDHHVLQGHLHLHELACRHGRKDGARRLVRHRELRGVLARLAREALEREAHVALRVPEWSVVPAAVPSPRRARRRPS